MQSAHTVLVPVLKGDISERTLRLAERLVRRDHAKLVVLHVEPPCHVSRTRLPASPSEPRWHRLASMTPADRVFVEAIIGEPAEVIRAEAERFGSHAIVLGGHVATELDPSP
jgi:nucleotide-binding universal stress UspA family protein